MASILSESPHQPTPEYEVLTGYSAEADLTWIQNPIIQDAVQWCLKRPKGEWEEPEYVNQVADFLTDRSHQLLDAAEKLKLQDSPEGHALEQAREHFFAARILAGLKGIITETRDITWLQSLIDQDKNTILESEEKEADRILEIAESETVTDKISLTEQVIQTMVVNEDLAASEIETMVESVSAFRNGWVMGVVEELMAGADTMSKAAAVDKLTELYFRISSEIRLNRNRIDANDGSLASHEAKVLTQANTILQVAERVFIDLAARINRTGDIKKCVIAVMEVEVEELRTQARAILEGPAFTTKQEMDWARQTLEVLKTGMSEEAYQNTSSPQVIEIETDEEQPEPPTAIDDDTQAGMPVMSDGAAQARVTSVVEKPSFVQSITLGGEPAQPLAGARATSKTEYDVSEIRHGGLEAPVVILTPEIRKSLIEIALALGDGEAERIARQDQHSSEEIELLKAMAHRAHLLKEKRENTSGQSSGRPDIVERAKVLSSFVGPLKGKGA